MYQQESLRKNTQKRRNSSMMIDQILGSLPTDFHSSSLEQGAWQPNHSIANLQSSTSTQQVFELDSISFSPDDIFYNFGHDLEYPLFSIDDYSIPTPTPNETNFQQPSPSSGDTLVHDDFDIDRALSHSTNESHEMNVQQLTQELIHSIADTENERQPIVNNIGKRFKCSFCRKRFTHRKKLKIHKQAHKEELLFKIINFILPNP